LAPGKWETIVMQGPARVLIVGDDTSKDKQLNKTLTQAGFECAMGAIAQSATELCGTRRPDVVVLNMHSADAQKKPDTYFALAKALKASALSSRMRTILVGTEKNLELEEAAANIDDLLIGDLNPKQISHRVRSLIRLNTMHEELVRRLNTSAKYGLDAPPPVTQPDMAENATIMVLGDPAQFAMIENSLSKQATLVGALSDSTALDYLARRSFDAILISSPDTIEPHLPFVQEIRQQSRLFNLPVLALVSPDELTDCDKLYEAGVTDALSQPCSSQELRIRVNLLVRESRFRDSLKTIYQQAKHLATSDALTGLYSRGFLLEHLASMVSDASRTSQGFTLATLSISNIADINEELGYAGGDRIIRQVGEVTSFLIRGEDLAARYSGSKFIVALPDTPVERAKIAIQRITGVVAHTEFAVEDHYAPISVRLESKLVGFEQGDTAEALIGRSRNVDLKAAA